MLRRRNQVRRFDDEFRPCRRDEEVHNAGVNEYDPRIGSRRRDGDEQLRNFVGQAGEGNQTENTGVQGELDDDAVYSRRPFFYRFNIAVRRIVE